ncbi:MAG TPA: hypothetical protein VFX16_35045 [Pseudonocardiaceae bacterium]|nr:hypothetical protein [Pseudonocardiaceae bacterium]
MTAYGITYDTGFVNEGVSTREPFDPDVVRREMRIIHDDLHCSAVRITGGDPDRLELAARCAADAGLALWLSPFTCGLTVDELLALLGDLATRAERLRLAGADVVFLTGSELSIFNIGFLPGDTLADRLGSLAGGRAAVGQVATRINDFLGRAVTLVRERFGGRISYAALPFEQVDWAPFDIIATDAGYRSAATADRFADEIRAFAAQDKPVAVTEFGCMTHRGAAALGARADVIIEWDGATPVRLTDDYVRDEAEQATYVRELLDVFTEAGVDTVFVNTFASYHLPRRDGTRRDLDLASYGIVTVFEDRLGATYPDMPWEPKAAFNTLAGYRASTPAT